MAKYKQSKNDRLDESLGMRRGPERDFKQSYKDRRDESRGMKRAMDSKGRNLGSKFDIKDNTQAGEVKGLPTNSEDYDMNRIKPYSSGDKGYPAEAWNYKY